MNISDKEFYLKVKDYSVSQEEFQLYFDKELDMLITYPQPNLNDLGRYYDNPNYISHTDSRKTFFEKLYFFVKQITLKSKTNLINKYSEKGNLLDIGCGTGDFLTVAKNNGWKVSGFEPNDGASKLAEQKGVDLIQNFENIKDETFDVITMWHVLEHVPDLDNQINHLKRILKKNGVLVVAVPNFKSFDAKYYKNFWAAYDVPIHFWHFSKNSIKKLFENKGMSLLKTLPMYFDSFYVALLSEKYKTGKMNFISAFFIGLWSNFKGVFSKEYSSHIYIIKK